MGRCDWGGRGPSRVAFEFEGDWSYVREFGGRSGDVSRPHPGVPDFSGIS